MRVGIDLHVVDGKFQGSRTHVIELFSRVIGMSPDMEFFLFLAEPEKLSEYRPEFSLPNVHQIHMPSANPLVRLAWQLPRMQKRYALDLLHTQYILPFPSLSAGMVTIHDVLFESHPQYFGTFFRLRSKLLMRTSSHQASHTFTVSEFSKSEIVSRYGVDPAKVSVIHNAADRARFHPGQDGEALILARGLASGGYLLTVGRIEPRKNHERLLKAYASLTGDVPRLVIVGQKDFGVTGLDDLAAQLGVSNKVTFIEDASDAELPALYRHAKAFVFPAFAEGFGMPPLEAMASGVPVIAANTTAIPEVVGDGGILVDPFDVAALSRGMQSLLENDELHRQLASRALARAQTFKWENAAAIVRQRYLATRPRE